MPGVFVLSTDTATWARAGDLAEGTSTDSTLQYATARKNTEGWGKKSAKPVSFGSFPKAALQNHPDCHVHCWPCHYKDFSCHQRTENRENLTSLKDLDMVTREKKKSCFICFLRRYFLKYILFVNWLHPSVFFQQMRRWKTLHLLPSFLQAAVDQLENKLLMKKSRDYVFFLTNCFSASPSALARGVTGWQARYQNSVKSARYLPHQIQFMADALSRMEAHQKSAFHNSQAPRYSHVRYVCRQVVITSSLDKKRILEHDRGN